MRRALVLGALAVGLVGVPAANAQPSPYATLTVTESMPGFPDDTYQVACDWYPAADARDMIDTGSYRVILPGNHGWLLCN